MIYEVQYDTCSVRFPDIHYVVFLSKYILQFVLDFSL